MSTSQFGVDTLTGRVSLPVALGTLSGPRGFGETLAINYSTTGLLKQIQTWNEEAPTSCVGLGWTFTTPYIMRIRNGSWQDAFYLVNGENTLPLLLKQSPLINHNYAKLKFVTQAKSLLKVTYAPSNEIWTLEDEMGVKSFFGGWGTSAVDLGVRWAPSPGQAKAQPFVWVGSSTETAGQQNYVLAWRLSKKTTLEGQKVTYHYIKHSQKVGSSDGPGLSYTVASYLSNVKVSGGDEVFLHYVNKEPWEHPTLHHKVNPSDGTITNAFQDRVEKQFLHSLDFYNVDGVKQTTVELGYDFLYNHFNQAYLPPDGTQSPLVRAVNKRVLTNINTYSVASPIQSATTPQTLMFPYQRFDYWGLFDTALQAQIGMNAGVPPERANFDIIPTSAFLMSGLTPTPPTDESYPAPETGRTYNAIFGYLKNIESPEGSLSWYSYSDNSQNPPLSTDTWNLQLDSDDIQPPAIANIEGNAVTWDNPRSYWGNDTFVVLRWDGTAGNEKWIYLQIYEWLGRWIPVPCFYQQNNQTQQDIDRHL